MTDSPLLRRDIFDELVEQIGEDAVRRIVGMFLEETGDCIALLHETAGTPDPGNRERARRAAHSLKGSAAQLGAAALAAAASQVEAAVLEPGFDRTVAAVERCAAETKAALAARLGG